MSKTTARRTSRPEHTELHKLLVKACPPVPGGGVATIKTLAPHLGVSYQYVYRWIESNKLPPKYVTKLLEVADGRIDQASLIPYVI